MRVVGCLAAMCVAFSVPPQLAVAFTPPGRVPGGEAIAPPASSPGLKAASIGAIDRTSTVEPNAGTFTLQQPPATAKRADFSAAAHEASDEPHEVNQDFHIKRIRSAGRYPVLVVNQDCQPLSYIPLSVIRWQDALKAIFLDRVNVLSYYDSYIMSTRSKVQLPSVVCLKHYQKPNRERGPALNRRNVYMRDGYSCQYCGIRLKSQDLTLDHVVPKCKGGKAHWTNLVTACRVCNKRKGSRSVNELKDVGMMLRRPPRRPTMMELQQTARVFKAKHIVHESWEFYLGISRD